MEERLQKILARAGFGSRRANEGLIEHGRVTVNGKVALLGSKADPTTDRIAVDGRPIQLEDELLYIALYKPRNVISAVSSPDRRQTVRDLVPVQGHLFPVGRLDVDSEGLILLTNDGELANRLTHPKFGHEKEYKVLVARQPDEQQLNTWRRGVVLEDGYKTAPAQVHRESLHGKGAWLRITLREGRKRQIREVGTMIGLPVVKIIRVRIGTLRLGSLRPGDWRPLTEDEVREIKREAAPPPTRQAGQRSELPRRPVPSRAVQRRGLPQQSEPRPDSSRRSEPRQDRRPPKSGRKP